METNIEYRSIFNRDQSEKMLADLEVFSNVLTTVMLLQEKGVSPPRSVDDKKRIAEITDFLLADEDSEEMGITRDVAAQGVDLYRAWTASFDDAHVYGHDAYYNLQKNHMREKSLFEYKTRLYTLLDVSIEAFAAQYYSEDKAPEFDDLFPYPEHIDSLRASEDNVLASFVETASANDVSVTGFADEGVAVRDFVRYAFDRIVLHRDGGGVFK